MHKTLDVQLPRRNHPNNLHQGMAGNMMSPKASALVSTTRWEIPERMGVLFVIPRAAITETDQRIAERRWTVMNTRETNDGNLNTCLVTTFERVIPQVYHTGGTKLGRGGFSTLTSM